MTELRQRMPRERDQKYLAAIRQLPCLICGKCPCGEAAHIRMADLFLGKPPTGMGEKPSDKWTVPLCHLHHMEQHQHGERIWWETIHWIDPTILAAELYALRYDVFAMTAVINRSRR